MSHIKEEYAKACGVKIGKAVIHPLYYPIPFEKYITIYNSPIQSKNYSYWEESISLLKEALAAENIHIVQILEKDQEPFDNVDFSFKIWSYKQLAYVIKNSIGIAAVDSLSIHLANEFNIPIVGIYSSSSPKNCGPYKNEKAILIEPELNGDKPSYSFFENEKTIDLIFPEVISSAVLKSLNIDKEIDRKTIYIGKRCLDQCCDIIPSDELVGVFENSNIRMDKNHNEDFLKAYLNAQASEITIAKPISNDILLSRKIKILNYMANEFDRDFVNYVLSLGITINLICTDKDLLAQQRLNLFDFNIEFLDLRKKIEDGAKIIEGFEINNLSISSRKKVVFKSKIYNSLYEYSQNIDDFCIDLEWMMLYTNK
jgi:hypothetical protein